MTSKQFSSPMRPELKRSRQSIPPRSSKPKFFSKKTQTPHLNSTQRSMVLTDDYPFSDISMDISDSDHSDIEIIKSTTPRIKRNSLGLRQKSYNNEFFHLQNSHSKPSLGQNRKLSDRSKSIGKRRDDLWILSLNEEISDKSILVSQEKIMDYVRQVKEKEDGDLDKSRDQIIESFKRKLFDLLDEGESPNKAVRRLEHRLKKVRNLYSHSKASSKDEPEEPITDFGIYLFNQLTLIQLIYKSSI